MLATRVKSAAILFAIVIIPALLGGLPFFALVALITALASDEFNKLLRSGGHYPQAWLVISLSLLFIVQAQWATLLPLPLLLTGIVIGTLLLSLWHQSPQPVTDWALMLAGSLYLGWLSGHAITLRTLPNGLTWLALGAFMVWAGDVSAFFAGRAWGRHRWWPRHSPKKSWEGYIAGALATMLVGLLGGHYWVGLGWLEGSVLGALVGLVVPLGDLAESMLKRQVHAKDSGTTIPGHGGVLDRIDTLLIALPLVFYWASAMPRWPF